MKLYQFSSIDVLYVRAGEKQWRIENSKSGYFCWEILDPLEHIFNFNHSAKVYDNQDFLPQIKKLWPRKWKMFSAEISTK